MMHRCVPIVLGIVIFAQVAASADPYEQPPTLRAADLLPTVLLEGERHTVDPEVETDGFMAYFTIHSDYGTYKAASLEDASIRVREVYAIAALDEMSRAKVAGEAVVEGVKKPFLTVQSTVTRPAETVKNLGKGVGRWVERGKLSLHKAKSKAEDVYEETKEDDEEQPPERNAVRLVEQEVRARAVAEDRDPDAAVEEYRRRREAEGGSQQAAEADAQRRQEQIDWAADQLEKAAYKYVGYDKARRHLAQKLGVDPYSTNLELQKRLDSMGWALWAGQFGTGYMVPSSEVLGYVEEVNDLVWTSHPQDLEIRNRKLLEDMGVQIDTVDAFFENRHYTASHRTSMVSDLAQLQDTAQREHFFRLAIAADGWRLAAYYRRSARMLARTHEERPFERLVERSEMLVAAVTRSGDIVLLLPVDHLAWTETLDLVTGGLERLRREAEFDGGVVLLLAGNLTPRARRGVEALGWKVETWGLENLAELDSDTH